MRSHGWTVYEEDEIVEEYYGEKLNAAGEKIYKGKLRRIADKKGKLVAIKTQRRTKLITQKQEAEEASTLDFQVGDVVSWEDGSGVHKGDVEQADERYFTVRDQETKEVIPAIEQQRGKNKMFKVISRRHTFANFPVGTPIISSLVDKGKVISHQEETNSLLVETFMGDEETVPLDDPKLKKFHISVEERVDKFRKGMKVKYRVAHTKEWEEAEVLGVNDNNLVVRVLQNKINLGNNGMLTNLDKATQAEVTGKTQGRLVFKTAEIMTASWPLGSDLFFQTENKEYMVKLTMFGTNKNYVFVDTNTQEALANREKLVPLTSLSLTVIDRKHITQSGVVEFSGRKEEKMTYQEMMRKELRRDFEVIIKEYYPMWSIADGVELEDKLFAKNSDFISYTMQVSLLLLALNPNDPQIGEYSTFFRSHVRSKMFTMSNLEKADINYILPELVNNTNLKTDQYNEAMDTMKKIQEEFIIEKVRKVKSEIVGKKYKRIRDLNVDFLTMKPFVMKDIHSVCRNIGSLEIPTESLVLCQEGSEFYCFSVHDVVLGIEKADREGIAPKNPFTERDFDRSFVKRVREMFMVSQEGKQRLEQLPKAQRDYNLVYGDVVPNKVTSNGQRGVTLSEFIAMNPKVDGRTFDIKAGTLLQDLAFYILENLIEIIGVGKYSEEITIIRAMDIWLEETNDIWRRAITRQVADDMNIFSRNPNTKNVALYNKITYANELLESLASRGKNMETNPTGLVILGSLIYSLLQLILHPIIVSKSGIIDDVDIKTSIMEEPNLKILFATAPNLPLTRIEKLEVLFGKEEAYEEDSPNVKIIDASAPQFFTAEGETPSLSEIKDTKMYPLQTTMVKSFYKVKPALLEPKKKDKSGLHTFNNEAGHELYMVSAKFVSKVLNSSDEKMIDKDSMLVMIGKTLESMEVSDDFSHHIMTPVNKYMSAMRLKFKFDTKAKTDMDTAQTNLVSLIKKENLDKTIKKDAAYILLFAVGALIRHILVDTNVTKGTITQADIGRAMENDPDLMLVLM